VLTERGREDGVLDAEGAPVRLGHREDRLRCLPNLSWRFSSQSL
jgi:hypothetical protein